MTDEEIEKLVTEIERGMPYKGQFAMNVRRLCAAAREMRKALSKLPVTADDESKIWTLEHWSIIDRNPNMFLRLPECAIACFFGFIHGREGYESDIARPTSPIERYDQKRCAFVTASGSHYRLGKIDPEFARVSPCITLDALVAKYSIAPIPAPGSGAEGE